MFSADLKYLAAYGANSCTIFNVPLKKDSVGLVLREPGLIRTVAFSQETGTIETVIHKDEYVGRYSHQLAVSKHAEALAQASK